jgi:hypothetical protein
MLQSTEWMNMAQLTAELPFFLQETQNSILTILTLCDLHTQEDASDNP